MGLRPEIPVWPPSFSSAWSRRTRAFISGSILSPNSTLIAVSPQKSILGFELIGITLPVLVWMGLDHERCEDAKEKTNKSKRACPQECPIRLKVLLRISSRLRVQLPAPSLSLSSIRIAQPEYFSKRQIERAGGRLACWFHRRLTVLLQIQAKYRTAPAGP